MAYQPAGAAPASFVPAAYAYQAQQQQQPGLLQPGQVINVNGIVVTVERYLSQGGFAHVYIVQSPAPINGTRQHVLKRMAVPDEPMLREVKQEVDVMKLLRGHPNIVNFIEASSQPLANGAHEVFILMEFCPGGGIIDMMNRRLRERLTEAEILTIFVDVCEGLACMHSLKPPLLHRDLKVENILQASATSYKLCDFGSATPTSTRAPSTSNELRALEYDLNRHTTLQYRAPEMIDVYLRRPVDEKSDVWALGVLLYKLCYYTTPFEEHGPLAILNVSYRTPPYPVYSSQMNTLIASMLRDHGSQRPSVFDLLDIVHRMRGTKSKFRYERPQASITSPSSIPSPQISSAAAARQKPAIASLTAPDPNGRKDEPQQQHRRGRPSAYGGSLVPSPMPLSPVKSGPSKLSEPAPPRLPPVRMEVTRLADSVLPKASTPPVSSSSASPGVWSPATTANGRKSPGKFDSRFDSVSIQSTLGTGKAGPGASSPVPGAGTDDLRSGSSSSRPPVLPTRDRPLPPGRLNPHHRTGPTSTLMGMGINNNNRSKDAFDSLSSAFPSKPALVTLGSAMSSTNVPTRATLDIPQVGAGIGQRSPSAPRASGASASQFKGSSPVPDTRPSYQTSGAPAQQLGRISPRLAVREKEKEREKEREPISPLSDLPADERFPSLEEMERRFTPVPNSTFTSSTTTTSTQSQSRSLATPTPPTQQQRSSSPSRNRPLPTWRASSPQLHPNGPRARSPPVPSKDTSKPNGVGNGGQFSLSDAGGQLASNNASSTANTSTPSLPTRPANGSRFTGVSMSATGSAAGLGSGRTASPALGSNDAFGSSTGAAKVSRRQSLQVSSRIPSSSITPASKPPPRDWLTGTDDESSSGVKPSPAQTPVSPARNDRRASRIISSPRKDSADSRSSSIPVASSYASPRKSAVSSSSTLAAPSTPTGLGRLSRSGARSDAQLSAESSGGEDGPEDATPSANVRKIQMTTSSLAAPMTKSTFVSNSGSGSNVTPTRRSSIALREEAARKPPVQQPHLRKPSSADLLSFSSTGDRPPLSPTKKRSVQDIVDEMVSGSPSRTPRRQNSAQDISNSSSSLAPPIRSAAAARNARTVQPLQPPSASSGFKGVSAPSSTSHLRAGSMNTTFTTAVVNPMATPNGIPRSSSPSPAPYLAASQPPSAAAARPLPGGGRLRPQSLFLPTSAAADSFLRPPGSAEPSPLGGGSDDSPSSASDRPRAQRRLSISDMVHKFEALNTGDAPVSSPVLGSGYPSSPTRPLPPGRVPSGGGYLFPRVTGSGTGSSNAGAGAGFGPRLNTGSGTARPPPTSSSKPPTSGAYRAPGRSPVSPAEPNLLTAAEVPSNSSSSHPGRRSSPAAALEPSPIIAPKSYQRSNTLSFSNPSANLPSSSAEAAHMQGQAFKDSMGIASPVASKRLNVVPPGDFLGAGALGDNASAPLRPAPLPSPSPERPYQGVGKLIAEWSKKTEPSNVPPKVSGRAGLR